MNDADFREAINRPHDPKAALKAKLCAAIDALSDADGFVLVATADDITWTDLKAAGWDERVLELEPLKAAEVRREVGRLWDECEDARRVQAGLDRRHAELEREIAEKEARLADVNAALANVLGEKQ